jgi:hypothetical protein
LTLSERSHLHQTTSDSGEVNVTTLPFHPPGPLPFINALTTTHTASASPIVVLSSGRVYDDLLLYGDAMFGTYLNDACPSNYQQLWSVNDLSTTSEGHAPLFGQALYSTSGTVNLRIAATELPYEAQGTENPVRYRVGNTTTLIALSGNIPINGGVAQIPSSQCAPNSYIPAGTGSRDYWNTSFTVQTGQNGNVMFLLKTRVLDCVANQGPGTVLLQLKLDGQLVGSVGDQQFTFNNTCHQRTLSASYLAMHLSTGPHTIAGNITTTGMANLGASGDLGLVFFGN